MIRRGIGVQSFVAAGGAGTDADAQAFITAAAITDVTQQSAINTLVTDLKGYGIWSKMKAIYPFVGGTASAHKFNLKDPRDLDAAFRLVFSGGMLHSSNGILFGGVNGYANTFLNTQTQTTFNNLHLSVYCRTDTSGTKCEMGNVQNVGNFLPIIALQIKTIQGGVANRFATLIYSYNVPDIINVENLDAKGFYTISRTAANSYKGFKNGSQIGSTVTTNSQTVAPNFPIFIGGFNAAGTAGAYTDREHAFASIGDGLTDTEASNLYTAVQAYQTTLSRNV